MDVIGARERKALRRKISNVYHKHIHAHTSYQTWVGGVRGEQSDAWNAFNIFQRARGWCDKNPRRERKKTDDSLNGVVCRWMFRLVNWKLESIVNLEPLKQCWCWSCSNNVCLGNMQSIISRNKERTLSNSLSLALFFISTDMQTFPTVSNQAETLCMSSICHELFLFSYFEKWDRFVN